MNTGKVGGSAGGRRLRTLDDLPVDGRRVLLRVDFNVTGGADGKIDAYEDYRIEAALDTINELRRRRCKVLLLTHRGRPDEDGADTDLAPVRQRLRDLIGEDVLQVRDLYGMRVDVQVSSMEPGGVLMLPNVRLDERETKGNHKFAAQLASNADMFVNEAFSVSHRAHTSVAFVPHELPSCAGRRTAVEVEELSILREHPEQPYVAIASGNKITTKIGMLHDLLRMVERLCIGGALASVFLAARGDHTNHAYSTDELEAARYVLQIGADKVVLPVDVIVGETDGTGARAVAVADIPEDAPGLFDIGPQSVELFLQYCTAAKTVMWNGPVGRHEIPPYDGATRALARGMARLTARRVVGGGDTVVALEQEGVRDMYDHVSVGGGAMVAFLEGRRMPGLEPLYEKV